MTYYLYYIRLSKAQDYMDSMLWEQEAASSSLATPTTRKAARKRLRTFPGGFLFVLKDGVTWADGRCKPGCRRRRTGSGR